MHCKQFEARLHYLMDHRLSPDTDSQVQSHACHCYPCQHLLEYQSKLILELQLQPASMPPPGFAQRVVSHCNESAGQGDLHKTDLFLPTTVEHLSTTSRKTWMKLCYRFTWIAMATAAALLLISLNWQSKSDSASDIQVAKQARRQSPIATKQQRAADPDATQQLVVDHADQIIAPQNQGPGRSPIQWLKTPNEEVSNQIGSWVHNLSHRSADPLARLTDGLRPISCSFTLTWKSAAVDNPGYTQQPKTTPLPTILSAESSPNRLIEGDPELSVGPQPQKSISRVI